MSNLLDSRSRTRKPRSVPERMHEDEVPVDEELVRRLLAAQLPELADEPLTIVEPWGTDNAIWRVGHELVVRLPRIHWAVGQVAFEAEWLPRLAPYLPTPVPIPVAIGKPAEGYPYPWAVHRWIPGTSARIEDIEDPVAFAHELADVTRSLWTIPTRGAPPARNRARPLQEYDAETRWFIEKCATLIDADPALEAWETALGAPPHQGPLVWVHGDLDGNYLLREGRLAGLVDWGSACVGDPAVDVQMVWSPLFDSTSREVFLRDLEVDDVTLARSKGAVVHQACGAVSYYSTTYPLIMERSWHKLEAVGVPRLPER